MTTKYFFHLSLVLCVAMPMACDPGTADAPQPRDVAQPGDGHDDDGDESECNDDEGDDEGDGEGDGDDEDNGEGDDGEGDDGDDDACAAIVGESFVSVEELECGPSMGVQVLCAWTVSFGEDGTFNWHMSDTPLSGTYTCDDGTLTVTPDIGDPIVATYDPMTATLTWDGDAYVAAP